jgi:mannose-1-phosphate guanylyltransferase
MIIPIILAGGSGTRLWPLSRQLYPKQLIGLVDDRTLLQNTLVRLTGLDRVSGPMVVCNQDHRFMVAEQVREINADTAAIILEPVGRNTAPAIVDACRNALDNSRQDLDFLRLEGDAFSASPSDSIDYAVMEKTDIGVVVPLSAGWNDLGSWEALWQTGQKDDIQNVIHGDVLMSDVKNSYLYAESWENSPGIDRGAARTVSWRR